MADKPFQEMTDDELWAEHKRWCAVIADEASGWSSAYFAATCLKGVVRVATDRGIAMENPYPIRVGGHAE